MTRDEIIVQNKDVAIHTLEFNRESNGIPMVIIPGAINAAEEIEKDVQGKLGRHHIILSLRGRGKSTSPEKGYSLSDQASDVLAVIEHYNLEECILFGHSLGSSIGIEAAWQIREKVKGFIIGDFPPFYPPYGEKWRERVLARESLHISQTAVNGIAAEAEHVDLSKALGTLGCPILLVKGEKEDSLVPLEDIGRLKEIIPAIGIALLAESGHDIFRPDPEPLVQRIEEFIESVEDDRK